MKKFAVNENMIMWAFRYALGRRTGAVQDVIDSLKQNWHGLDYFTRDQIKREIREAIKLDQAGAECDVNNWNRVLEEFERAII